MTNLLFIKLLCTKISNFKDVCGKYDFTIEEGSTVSALINREGVRLEYEPRHYSVPYRFEDIGESFISAFDEKSYNRIYHKAKDCKVYFEDGTSIDLGDAVIKF